MPCERFGCCKRELKVHETSADTWLPADIRILGDDVKPWGTQMVYQKPSMTLGLRRSSVCLVLADSTQCLGCCWVPERINGL